MLRLFAAQKEAEISRLQAERDEAIRSKLAAVCAKEASDSAVRELVEAAQHAHEKMLAMGWGVSVHPNLRDAYGWLGRAIARVREQS